MFNKRGQLTIFIIIAVLIVAGVALFFTLRNQVGVESLPASIAPVENSFLLCLEDNLETGIDVLESQGGYINLPSFESGSEYMPFSSYLDFAGSAVPYWYYKSGNNLERTQVPTVSFMQEELENFVEQKIIDCNLASYADTGYFVDKIGEPVADIIIREDEVEVKLDMVLDVSYFNDSASIKDHSVVLKSSLGKLYDSAVTLYEYEQNTLFLETYAKDFLYLYAPVEGVELSCAPITWDANEVFDSLEDAIEVNTMAFKNKGANDDYFALNLPIEQEVSFVTSRNWSKTYEVTPSEESLLVATPVGSQAELGVLGFCYVPYHFIYDLKYPVMIRISEEDETFQFPMAVILENNNPREPLSGEATEIETIGLCENANTLFSVDVLDYLGNSIPAKVSYECFGEQCSMGTSPLNTEFPQCVNGQLIVTADGYRKVTETVSTLSDGLVTIYMEKLYPLEVQLTSDGTAFSGEAMINFISDDYSETLIYPQDRLVELSEGEYTVEVYTYSDSSIELGSVTKEQCVEVPTVLGFNKKECYDIEIPSQIVSSSLSGGGSSDYFISELELSSSSKISIDFDSLPVPTTIEELQDNYGILENSEVEVSFE